MKTAKRKKLSGSSKASKTKKNAATQSMDRTKGDMPVIYDETWMMWNARMGNGKMWKMRRNTTSERT